MAWWVLSGDDGQKAAEPKRRELDRDGQHFIFNTFVEDAPPVTVLLNWKPKARSDLYANEQRGAEASERTRSLFAAAASIAGDTVRSLTR